MNSLTIRSFLAMLCLLLLALLILAPFKVFAADNNVTIVAPTMRTDGSALPASQIAGYEISCASFTPTGGSATACPSGSPVTLLPGLTGLYTLTIPATGGKVCLQGRTKDTNGLFSDYKSADNCKTFAAIPPNPPGAITVAVVIGVNVVPVYGVNTTAQRQPDVLGFVPVGTAVTPGVVYTYRGQGYCYVPQAAVKWWASTPTKWALAACS